MKREPLPKADEAILVGLQAVRREADEIAAAAQLLPRVAAGQQSEPEAGPGMLLEEEPGRKVVAEAGGCDGQRGRGLRIEDQKPYPPRTFHGRWPGSGWALRSPHPTAARSVQRSAPMLGATKERGPLRPSTRRGVRIRVLLVAGQALLRAALRAIVSRERDMEVVGGVGDDQAVSALAVATRPDVAVLDLSGAGPRSLVIGEAIRLANPATRLLVLGHDPDPSAARMALALGVTGYLVKDADAAELLEAIRAVYRSRLFVHLVASGDTGLAWGAPAAEPSRRSGRARLSTRERHLLTMVAEGYTSRQIGQALSVSPKTVATHRTRIATKLGLQIRSEPVRLALDRGLLKGRAVGPSGEISPRVVTGNNDGTNS